MEITAGGSLVSTTSSAYRRALADFNRTAPDWGSQFDLHVHFASTRWWRFGVRAGWTRFTSEPVVGLAGSVAPYNRDAPLASGTMTFDLVDLDGVARFFLKAPAREPSPRLHIDFEAGLVVGGATLHGVTQALVAPRLGLSFFVGWQDTQVMFGLRFGAQYVPWHGAGGSVFDPAFAGLLFGFEVGWSR